MKKKIMNILVIVLILLISILFYLYNEITHRISSEFVVSGINGNFLEVWRKERVTFIESNGDLKFVRTQVYYNIDMNNVEIRNANNKKISLADLREGDLIEVTQKIEDGEELSLKIGTETYIECVVSIKVLENN